MLKVNAGQKMKGITIYIIPRSERTKKKTLRVVSTAVLKGLYPVVELSRVWRIYLPSFALKRRRGEAKSSEKIYIAMSGEFLVKPTGSLRCERERIMNPAQRIIE